MDTVTLCRDCLTVTDGAVARCPNCRSPRVISLAELLDLSIAHIDCDAFYASVEKLDNPELRDKPIIVGGGQRGVVTTACYIARIKGVRSAMPMFQARKLCPEALVIPTRMSRYVEVSKAIKDRFRELTPIVEPLSLDEAFLDLTGTTRLAGEPPAVQLARLAKRIETEIGVTVSVGLSHNKFLAKIASDLDKPRGFSVIGKTETQEFLLKQKVGIIWGVGPAMRASLEKDGIRTIADIHRRERKALIESYGSMGERLYHLSRGEDRRRVTRNAPVKSISNETTFFEDISDGEMLSAHLWRLAINVSDRAKARELAGRVINLKLKRRDFRALSRRVTLSSPAQLVDTIFRAANDLLAGELEQGPFRLIGVGIEQLVGEAEAGSEFDLLDPDAPKRAAAERASDAIREKFGKEAIFKGRSLK